MMTPNSRESLLTVAEVAVYLKVPRSTAYKLVNQEQIPGRKVGKHWRFMRDEVDGWLKCA